MLDLDIGTCGLHPGLLASQLFRRRREQDLAQQFRRSGEAAASLNEKLEADLVDLVS